MENFSSLQNRNAEKYRYGSSIDLNNPNHSWVMMLNHVTNNSTVLDVGCACGDFGVILKK